MAPASGLPAEGVPGTAADGPSAAQKARAERNRLRAKSLREARPAPRTPAPRDTGGGFLLDEEPEPAPRAAPLPAPLVHVSLQPPCRECGQPVASSRLLDEFGLAVCDPCRQPERHAMVSRTEAKAEFLLKDCDLDARPPPLRYVTRPNPHRAGGSMRLYLREQLEERAQLVWGGEEGLLQERAQRQERRELAAGRRYRKDTRALRVAVRGAGEVRAACQHSYEETELPDGQYRGVCILCGQELLYEKM